MDFAHMVTFKGWSTGEHDYANKSLCLFLERKKQLYLGGSLCLIKASWLSAKLIFQLNSWTEGDNNIIVGFSFHKLTHHFFFSFWSSCKINDVLVDKLASTSPCIWVDYHVLKNLLPLVCTEVTVFASITNLSIFMGCLHMLCQISLDLGFVITLRAIKNIWAVRNSSVIDHVAVTAELAIAKLANVCHIHMLCPKMMPYIDTWICFKRAHGAGKLFSQMFCLMVKLQQSFSWSFVVTLVTRVFYLPVNSILVLFHTCLCCCPVSAFITWPCFLFMNRLHVPRQVAFLSTFVVASMTMVKDSTVPRFLVVYQVPFNICVVFTFFTFVVSPFSFFDCFLFVMDILLVNLYPTFSECRERTHVTWPTNQFVYFFNVAD